MGILVGGCGIVHEGGNTRHGSTSYAQLHEGMYKREKLKLITEDVSLRVGDKHLYILSNNKRWPATQKLEV